MSGLERNRRIFVVLAKMDCDCKETDHDLCRGTGVHVWAVVGSELAAVRICADDPSLWYEEWLAWRDCDPPIQNDNPMISGIYTMQCTTKGCRCQGHNVFVAESNGMPIPPSQVDCVECLKQMKETKYTPRDQFSIHLIEALKKEGI